MAQSTALSVALASVRVIASLSCGGGGGLSTVGRLGIVIGIIIGVMISVMKRFNKPD